MKNSVKRIGVMVLIGALLSLLAGCIPKGGAGYEINYPSGYVRGPIVRRDDVVVPVEGTAYQLKYIRPEGRDDYQILDLQILNENDEVLYEYPGIGSRQMRGNAGAAENTIWVSLEAWSIPHYSGYINGFLDRSTLLLLDMQDGSVLFESKIEKNHLYLTTVDGCCYFYFPGAKAQKGVFTSSTAQNAEIYYRDPADWAEKHTVYTFDYVMEPDIDTENGVDTRVKFYLSEDQFRIAWTSYEEVGDGHWAYLEKLSYEIPVGVDASQSERSG